MVQVGNRAGRARNAAGRFDLQVRPAAGIGIVVTGYAQEQDRQEALAAGFNDLFAKPVDLATLNSLLTRIARRRLR